MLTRGPNDFHGISVADEPIVGLKVPQVVMGVVYKGKPGSFAAAMVGPEAKDWDGVCVDLVGFREPLAEVGFGDVYCNNILNILNIIFFACI